MIPHTLRKTKIMKVSHDTHLLIGHALNLTDLTHQSSGVSDSLNNVSSTSFTLGSHHSSTFVDSTEGLAEVLGTTDEGDVEFVLVDVVRFVSGGKHFGFVDVVDADVLEDLTEV
jgi:hypothetical protein